MTLPLREKRKQETAFQIQRATLELTVQKGLENVTTEEIAVASGVSTRTFFNYYPNKEAAAVGHPPKFSDEELNALRNGTGLISVDLKGMLDRHVDVLSAHEDILRMVGQIMRSNEKARGILEGHLAVERRAVTEALAQRVTNHQTAAALASNVSTAVGSAILLWENEGNLTLGAALNAVWEGLIDASQLLLSSDSS